MADQRITNSRANTFKTCARRHLFAYELGLRKEHEGMTLRFGSAVHIGLDIHKKGGTVEDAIRQAVEAYDANHPDYGDGWLVEREQIARLLSGYFWRWSVMPLEIVASELTFELPLVNPETGKPSRTFMVAGKIDAIVRLEDGRLAVMEHKTTGDDLDPTSDYWKRLRVDSQISIYWQAAKDAGHDIETVLYDVIRKPTIKPKKVPAGKLKAAMKDPKSVTPDEAFGTLAEIWLRNTYYGEPCEWRDDLADETPAMYGARLTADIAARPDYYYARQEIPRLAADLEDGRWDCWQTAKMIRDCQLNNRWPRNTSACIGFGRCPYFDLCTNGFDPSLGVVPDGFVRVEDVHAELKG
jgi:hypothetical protein